MNVSQKSVPPTRLGSPTEHGFMSFVALDCEFVGVGPNGIEHALARVSLVSCDGLVELDTHVAVDGPIVDFRTWCSGIWPRHLIGAPSFASVRSQVAARIKDRIVVGHAVHNDLQVLQLTHPANMIRDTQSYPPLQRLTCSAIPSLKNLARCLFNVDTFQAGEHDSIEDARMAMRIYLMHASAWEGSLKSPLVEFWSTSRSAQALCQRSTYSRTVALPPSPPASPTHTGVTLPGLLKVPHLPPMLPPTPPRTPPHASFDVLRSGTYGAVDKQTPPRGCRAGRHRKRGRSSKSIHPLPSADVFA